MKGQPHKVKAGALQFATLISVVIAVLLAAFILLTYTQLQFTRQLNLSQQLIQQSHDGLAYVKQKDIPYEEPTEVVLEGNSPGTLMLERTQWGIFDKIISTAIQGQKRHQKIAWMGGQLSSEQRPALYLVDSYSPLVVVGNTEIHGKALLPKSGVKAGNIVGTYYQGEQLIYGSRGVSKANLPLIPTTKHLYLQELLRNGIQIPDSLRISSVPNNPLQRSFTLPSQWLYRKGPIDLDQVDLEDNIIIKSDTLIRVSAFAKAKNIILVAPRIEIAANFKGSLQAIASKNIKIGISTQLKYPSALVVVAKKETKDRDRNDWTGIRVEQRAQIEGVVMYLGDSDNFNNEAEVQLLADSVLRGELYCEQATDIKGTVLGSVFTGRFAVKAKGSVYTNHLLDATIDSRNFPQIYGGITTSETKKTIVQWVD